MLVYINNKMVPFISPLIALMLIIVTGCSSNINSNHIKQDLTGEELFEAIFFAKGDLAKELPHINKIANFRDRLDNEQISEINSFQDRIINVILEANSSYFQDFKNSLKTGNHYLIRDMLKESTIKIENIASTILIEDKILNDEIYLKNLIDKMSASSLLDEKFDPSTLSHSELLNYVDNEKLISFAKENEDGQEGDWASPNFIAMAVAAVAAMAAVVLIAANVSMAYNINVFWDRGIEELSDDNEASKIITNQYSIESEQLVGYLANMTIN